MATLLAELLHDVSRRAGEIEAEFSRLKCGLAAGVQDYREKMEQRARKLKELAERILADPDLDHPALAVNFFRDFRGIVRFALELEHLPLLVLRRFSSEDEQITRVCRQICREIGFPYDAPVCSSLSSQYYWTVAGMDLVFVPSLEPERLLGLADLYHELGHIILYREENQFVLPGLAAVDKHFDEILRQGRQAGWPQPSLDEVEHYAGRWRSAWLLEFGSDLIATYLAGPAFGWCNIRTSTNLGAELFQGSESHPADDARAYAINLMLESLGASQDAEEIRERWKELTDLAGETPPSRYDIAYPRPLLAEICAIISSACRTLGLIAWRSAPSSAIVGQALHEAWTEFRLRPETFEGFEAASMARLVTQCVA